MTKKLTMSVSKTRATVAAGAEALIELAKLIPGVGSFIEGVRKYQENIEEQQREEFTGRLVERVDRLEASSEWYHSEEGQQFVKKVVATALNAEYADKLDYLANALANGHTLGNDESRRILFVEMIRKLSKPALDVLVTSIKHPTGTRQVMSGELAKTMGWHPAVVDACVQELYAAGVYSHVTSWSQGRDEVRPSTYFAEGTPALTDISTGLATFIN